MKKRQNSFSCLAILLLLGARDYGYNKKKYFVEIFITCNIFISIADDGFSYWKVHFLWQISLEVALHPGSLVTRRCIRVCAHWHLPSSPCSGCCFSKACCCYAWRWHLPGKAHPGVMHLRRMEKDNACQYFLLVCWVTFILLLSCSSVTSTSAACIATYNLQRCTRDASCSPNAVTYSYFIQRFWT